MEINLLPWRAETLAYNKKIFVGLMLGALTIACIIILLAYYVFFQPVSYSKSYVQALEESKTSLLAKVTAYLNQKQTQEKITARITQLEKLRRSRFEIVRLLNEIAKITPKGIYLLKLERNNDQVEVSGATNSNLQIATFIKDIDASNEFDFISLQKVEKTEGDSVVLTQFSLFLRLTMDPASPVSSELKTNTPTSNPVDEILKMQENRDKKVIETLEAGKVGTSGGTK